ncbi:hypothetical protein [Pseudarthrobacter sp. AB1]|nr:hypothetical protein [Pseudarthrobacter sp. AB1]MBE4720582.1 hypothetical protein [Pseudarthrobacter sp. AB1]
MEALRAKLNYKLHGITVGPASTITDGTIIVPTVPPDKYRETAEPYEFSAPTGAAEPRTR